MQPEEKARSSSLKSFSSHHKHQIYKVASCCTKVRIRPNARCLHCRLAQKCRQKKELHPAALSLLGMPLTPTSWTPWTLLLEFGWFSKISLKCRRLQSCFISLHLSKTSYLGGKAVSGSPVLTFTSQDADVQIIKKTVAVVVQGVQKCLISFSLLHLIYLHISVQCVRSVALREQPWELPVANSLLSLLLSLLFTLFNIVQEKNNLICF